MFEKRFRIGTSTGKSGSRVPTNRTQQPPQLYEETKHRFAGVRDESVTTSDKVWSSRRRRRRRRLSVRHDPGGLGTTRRHNKRRARETDRSRANSDVTIASRPRKRLVIITVRRRRCVCVCVYDCDRWGFPVFRFSDSISREST